MYKGTVKWFDNSKGFGFITLTEGQTVSYDVTNGPKGLQAINVIIES